MKKHLALLIASVAISFSLYAEPVTPSQARRIAERFLGTHSKSIKSTITPRTSSGTDIAPYYVFNTDGRGFVIVSGDDAIGSIIGYSDSGTFSIEDAPSNLTTWLDTYSRYATKATKCISTQVIKSGTPIVEPLLANILWAQGSPFNAKCPTYTSQGTTTNYYVGCVATAMSQIMRYYKYPQQGTGSHSYKSNIGDLSADFGNTTYQWDDMLENYTGTSTQEQRDAVATLCAQVGVSVNMTYEPSGSGAYSQLVPGALKNYFGYDKGISYLVRDYYTSDEWMSFIKQELDAKRPVYYSASNDDGLGGHAFVCDGYDSNGFVYINWGWEGKSNGYFMVNYLNPDDLGIGSGSGGYNTGQEIIIGIQPSGKDNAIDFIQPIYGYTRFTASAVGGSCLAMTYLQNHNTEDFNGTIAAVLTQNSKVVKVLSTQEVTVGKVDPTKKPIMDFVQLTMRDIPTTATDVSNGNYHLCFAYKSLNSDKDWTLLRHSKGLPSYADVTIENGVLNISTHAIVPNVELTKPITFDGDVYAKGSAFGTFAVQNKSNDLFLDNIKLRLTSVNNPEETYIVDNKTFNSRVYDNAEKDIYFLFDVPEDIVSGKYTVTAFENKYESSPFDDSNVGRTIIDILPETKTPVIRATSAIDWIASPSNEQTINQGENLLATIDVRNYGAAGQASIKLCLKDENDKEYVFLQTATQDFKKAGNTNVKFYRRLDLNPGTYKFIAYYVTTEGTFPLVSSFDDRSVTVGNNEDLSAICENFTLPTELIKGQRYTGSLTIKALKDFSRTLYVRLRQFTNSGGEIVAMQSLSMSAGDTKTVNFKYTPAIDYGNYTPLVETRITSSSFEPVGNYDKYYNIFCVSDGSGITNVGADNDINIISDNGIVTVSSQSSNIAQILAYDTTGRLIGKYLVNDQQAAFAIPSGIYIFSIHTDNGIYTTKHIVK